MKSKIACVVLNYNGADQVIKLVEKIKNYDIDNIIIVDNQSTDNSYRLLEKYIINQSKVTLINSGKNGGYGYGNNIGIKYAVQEFQSKYIIISNPDVSFTNELIHTMVRFMKKSNAAIVSGRQRVNGKAVKVPGWAVPTALEWTLIETKLRFIVKHLYYYPQKYYHGKFSKVDCVLGAMIMIDARKFCTVGGYDTDQFLFGEETTLGYKLKKADYNTYLLNNEFYDHRISSIVKKNIPKILTQEKITHQSKLIFFRKYLHVNRVEYWIIRKIFKFIEYRDKRK